MRITHTLHCAPGARLRGSPCEAGGDAGVARVVMDSEVLSPGSGCTDRIDTLREYRAVSSVRRHVILQSRSRGFRVFDRAEGVHARTAESLVAEDILRMPDIGIEIPVAEFYERVAFEAAAAGEA